MVADSIDYRFDLPTIAGVTHLFEVDLGHLQLMDGVQQAGPLPGIRVADPPRRSARGRDRDKLLLSLQLDQSNGGAEFGHAELLDLAVRNYFGTPGTVTAAFRATFGAVSTRLLNKRRLNPRGGPLTAGLTCAVWRGSELYLAQAGSGAAFVLQRATAEQFPDEGRTLRPLGTSNNPDVLYYHTTLSEGDLLITCREIPSGWRLDTLTTVNTGSLEPALSRLVHLAGNSVSASVARFVATGEEAEIPAALDSFAQRRAAHRPPAAAMPLTPPVRPSTERPVITMPSARDDVNALGHPAPAAGRGETGSVSTGLGAPVSAEQEAESSLANILARVRAATDLGNEDVLSEEDLEEMIAPAAETPPIEVAPAIEGSPPAAEEADLQPLEVEEFEELSVLEDEQQLSAPSAPSDWDWPETLQRSNPPEAEVAKQPVPPQEWIELESVTEETAAEEDEIPAHAALPDSTIAPDDWIDPSKYEPAPLEQWEPVATEPAATTIETTVPQVVTPAAKEELPPITSEVEIDDEFDKEDELEDDYDEHEPRFSMPKIDPLGTLKDALARLRNWYIQLPLESLRPRLERGSSSFGQSLSSATRNLIARLLPINNAPTREGYRVPNRILIALAVLVPIVVVALASGLYLTEGQSRQFEAVMELARLEASQARIAPDPLAARPHWETAVAWLDQADALRPDQPEALRLLQEAQGVLDNLDAIVRVPVVGVTATGFNDNANITRLVAIGADLFALDARANTVHRAVRNVTGTFDIDRTFLCRPGLTGENDISGLVDIGWIGTPNVVDQEAILALSADGTIVYCLTDGASPIVANLTPPLNGWINPVALEIFADRLYVLDPGANQVWVFDRVGGVFSEAPSPYFSEAVFDLSNALDFVIAQGDLFILRTDGSLMQCTRTTFDTPDCSERLTFIDERLGHSASDRLADVLAPVSLVFDPPPEPSLYIAEADNQGAYQLSLFMVLQRQYRPAIKLDQPLNGVIIGSGKDIFFAAGNNVYFGRRP